ncbi:MAG: hypothetical protein SGILL_005824, partial [Bacillariaceae sp.]
TKRGSVVDVLKVGSPSKTPQDDDEPTDSNRTMPSGEQADKSLMTLSNGADIPPGFPLAAVDNNQVLPHSGEDGLDGVDNGDDRRSAVLDSTARLRERRIMSESMTSMTYAPSAVDKGGEKTRRSRRRSILGSMQAAEKDAANSSQRHPSQDPEDRRKSLRASVSESIKSSPKKPVKRHSIKRSESLSPQGKKKSVVDPLPNTNDLIPNIKADEKPRSAEAAITRKLERQSSRRSKSPGSLVEKKAAHSAVSSKEEKKEKSEKGLWWNLSKVDNTKSSWKSTPKKGSSQSVVSAPALAGKISAVFDKARGKKSKSEEVEEAETSNFARLEASTASLDLDLLTESPSIHKVRNVDELFGEGEKDTSLRDQDDEIVSDSSSAEDDNSYLQSNGVGAAPNGDPSRVSWVELPLFDPQRLLMKSTDHDGENEMTELSGHVRSLDAWKDSSLKELGKSLQGGEDRKKSNPSLQATIGKDSEKLKKTGTSEERTVVTTTTNSSESTAKTTNYIPSAKKPAKITVASQDLGESQGSLTMDQIGAPSPGEKGSSSSLSRSSKRSKESKSSKASKGSFKSESSGSAVRSQKESFKSESSVSPGKNKTRHSTKSRQRSSEKIRRKDDHQGTSKLHRRKSEKRGTGKDDQPPSIRSEDDAATQRRGEQATKGSEGHLPLKKRPSLERRYSNRSRPELTPKKSYLNKRRHLKSDKVESKQAKKAVNSSLDTFLDRIDNAAPVVKDDNRSVYSSMQDKDRKRRSREKKKKKNGEKLHCRRVKRSESKRKTLGDLIGLDSDHTDHDSMSITSAPLLQYKTSASSLSSKKRESQRPVVDLKQTQFSSKLTKLHVAF